jgi:hypothetical protein
VDSYWVRLQAVERALVKYRKLIAELIRQNRALQQQLRDQRGH